VESTANAAIGMINKKTTAVRVIPVPGKKEGDMVEFGGLLGRAPVMGVNPYSSDKLIRRKKRELVQTFIGDYCVGVVHAESYHSELGNELGKDNPHLDYIANVSVGGKRISLRTIHDEIDVSEVAAEYGGGGHAKASGCLLTPDAYELYVAGPFKIDPMRADAFRNQYNLKGSIHGSLYENRDEDQFLIYSKHRIFRFRIVYYLIFSIFFCCQSQVAKHFLF